MDFLKKAMSGDNNSEGQSEGQHHEQKTEGSSGGFMDKINSIAGGGKDSEQKEDGLDKAVDFVQEKVLGGGDQSNESAVEQAKDEQISDFIRGKYKDSTGKEFFVADKEH